MQQIIDWLTCVGAKIFPVLDTNKDGVLDKKDFQYLEKKTKDQISYLSNSMKETVAQVNKKYYKVICIIGFV